MKTLPLTLSLSLLTLLATSGCGSGSAQAPSPSKAVQNQPVSPAPAEVPAPEVSVVAVQAPKAKPSPVLVPFESSWRFTTSAEGYEGGWEKNDFDDSSWTQGKAAIGYGDKELGTKLEDSEHKGTTLSLRARAAFEVADASAYGALRVRIMRDDGIVIYLNGEEVARDNLPAGSLKAGAFAPKAVSGAAESEYLDLPLPTGKLVAGRNIVAVAVHQNRVTSSDLWFDIELTGEVK